MKKIPTMFKRDWDGDKSRVIDKIHHGCEWVADGEGVATRKIDGTSCLVRDGKLYKRRELREGDKAPDSFELVSHDEETNKRIGWIPVGDGPEDRWHLEAMSNCLNASGTLLDGTYELVGPKIQGNPEHYGLHVLVPHNQTDWYWGVPRTLEGLREWFKGRDIEGLVFHHPDGRMAKIKQRDLGMRRK
jgi:Family of unknown function (DUF5565)